MDRTRRDARRRCRLTKSRSCRSTSTPKSPLKSAASALESPRPACHTRSWHGAHRNSIERWPLANPFTISRGSKTEAVVVTVELRDGSHCGHGECVPYARYGETPERVVAAIEATRPALRRGLDRVALQAALPAGAARNALDCAFWDLNAKQMGRRAYELAGLAAPKPLVTAYTISLAAPEAMAQAAAQAAGRPLLKVKLGGGEAGHSGLSCGGAVRGAKSQSLWSMPMRDGAQTISRKISRPAQKPASH